MRLLIIEDDADIRESLGELLAAEGFEVATADNGKAALEHLAACQILPQVILLDLMMPVMNGWEFRLALSRDPEFSTIPVVVVSAVTAEGAQCVPDAEFVPKPIDIEHLLEVVDERAGPMRGAS